MITSEQKQKAESALHWALNHIGNGTYWHENHYPHLRAALDAVEVAPAAEEPVEPPAVEETGGELTSTGVEAPTETVEAAEPSPAKKSKRG